MFKQQLRDLYRDIEDINYEIQGGCVDPVIFHGMNDEENIDINKTLNTFDEKLGAAMDAINELLIEFYENQEETTNVNE